jgi:uncharacterized protein YndB with AHSA1/START domain
MWHALTDTKTLRAWFCAERINPVIDCDPQVGGTLRLRDRHGRDRGFHDGRGAATVGPDLALGRRPRGLHVAAELSPVDTGNRLALSHAATDNAYMGHRQGWSSCPDRLPGHLK